MGLDTSSVFPRLILLIAISVIKAEERLSWFTKDEELRRSIFVPDNLSEGKEETRTLPWVFHDDQQQKTMQLKCLMRGYNASNNPSDYMDARWSYPGFDESQVNTDIPAEMGDDVGVPFKIWTIEIKTTAADYGRETTTCEFQQGNFPLYLRVFRIDLKLLIFKRVEKTKCRNGQALLSFGLGENLDEEDLTPDIEEDIKRQISAHYKKSSSDVTRCRDGQTYCIIVPEPLSGIQIYCVILFSLMFMVYGGVMAHRLYIRCGFKYLLLWAANRGHSVMVALLIENEANIDIRDSKGRTPLMRAAHGGHNEVMKVLCEKGADVNGKANNHYTAIMWAASAGHTGTVKILCEHEADLNSKDEENNTAAMIAASAGHQDTERLLTEYANLVLATSVSILVNLLRIDWNLLASAAVESSVKWQSVLIFSLSILTPDVNIMMYYCIMIAFSCFLTVFHITLVNLHFTFQQ